jgi:hypothetical protein
MRSSFALFALLLLVYVSPARAQDPCADPQAFATLERVALQDDYDFALASVRLCLGSPQGDTATLVAAFDAATTDAKSEAERQQKIVKALTTLQEFAAQRAAQGPLSDEWIIVKVQLQEDLQHAQTPAPGVTLLPKEFWPDRNERTGVVANGTIRLLAPLGCPKPPAACERYAMSKDLIRVFNLVDRLRGYAQWDSLVKHAQDAANQTAKWQAYFDDTLPQYWWEVLYNGRRMLKHNCPRDPATGIQRGFCSVPDEQTILLHPAAAVQWVDGAKGENELAAAFMIELFGRNSWTWSGNTPTGQRGWSVIGAYSNRGANADKWSYGVMAHYAKFDLGITTTGHRIGIIVNVPLAEFFFAQKKQYLDYLQALAQPAAPAAAPN